ncbi:MAG: ribose 5-phosphate isomerase A [Deinococcales bacterium]
MNQTITIEALKAQAAQKAVEHVQSGMILGLGTGSTAKYAIAAIGEKWQRGELKDIVAIATSKASEAQAQSLGIPLKELDHWGVDVAIDGMDELSPDLQAIKGLGGALTREKIVESRAKKLILIADESKRVEHLGQKAPLPIEVIPLAHRAILAEIAAMPECLKLNLRQSQSQTFITDNGNYILDCHLQAFDPQALALRLKLIPGVVEHGLFLDMAQLAYIATPQGVICLERKA